MAVILFLAALAALSPRAVERLDTYEPPWPVPKVLRLTEGGRFNRALTSGSMINTFSVWTIEDWIDALEWAKGVGGLSALIARTRANACSVVIPRLATNRAIRTDSSQLTVTTLSNLSLEFVSASSGMV